jgi:hypothetical protein
MRIPASRLAEKLLAVVTLALLAACVESERPNVAVTPSAQAKVSNDQLVGRWGLGAYHQDAARSRTLVEAKSQCSNAYVITKGANGGVMMHVADSADLFELTVRVGADGKTFIGPTDQPPGSAWDREVVQFDGKTMTALWVDPEIASRYGTMVFVRCGNA